MRLFVGHDWAEDHHDVEVMNEAGRVLARKRLPEGVTGMGRLHELVGEHPGEDAGVAEVLVGIETDRGPWAAALIAAGYTVYPVNPLQASRYRERHWVSGAKSDGGDSHMLADMVRTDSHQLRPAARDTPQAQGIKVVARAHKTLIWDRTRQVQRLRYQLREYFPAAIEAFEDLDAPDAEIYRSQPGMGANLGARVLGEFGDDPHRYPDGKARKNYAATSPMTRASGMKKAVMARFIHNDRRIDALMAQAQSALGASPGARAFHVGLRARGIEHNDALRRLANRLVGILHGCLKTRTLYDEATA